MNKEWMHLPSRLVPEYEEEVQKFIAQARNYAKTREVILCPCKRCKTKKYMKFDQVCDHLIIKGIDPSYTKDISFSDLEDDDDDLLEKIFGSRLRNNEKGEASEWIQLNENSGGQGGKKKAGQSALRDKVSESEDSNDWLAVDDNDFDNLGAMI